MAESSRRGLGRGLSALLDEVDGAPVQLAPRAAAPDAAETGTDGDPREAPIELLRRNPDQPRRSFDEAELEDLVDSVREKGVLQPILVRPAPGAEGEWQIVAGERRWRAAQRAGFHSVPILVRRDLSEADVLEIAIVENVQRSDLDAIEEAAGYKILMDRFGHTQDAVSKVVGKSRSHVANALRLMSLPTSVQAMVGAGRLSGGHARALVGAAEPEKLAEQIAVKGLSVRQAEQLVRERDEGKAARARGAPKPRSSGGAKDADLRALEVDLSALLGLEVEIADRKGAGELRLRYATLDQLDHILGLLSR